MDLQHIDESVWWKIAAGAGIAFLTFFSKIWKAIVASWRWVRSPSKRTALWMAALDDFRAFKESFVKLAASVEEGFQNQNQTLNKLSGAIQANASRIFSVMNESPVPMFECELPSGECSYVNEAAAQLFGMPASAMLGDGWIAAVHPDDRDDVVRHWTATIRDWHPYGRRYRIIRKVNNKNETLTVFASATVVMNNGNAVLVRGKVEPWPWEKEAPPPPIAP